MDEQDELSDGELDHLLKQWKAPATPERLRANLFPDSRQGWWRRFWSGSIRVPLPAACCALLLLGVSTWRWMAPPDRVVVVQAPVGVPKFQPVSELRPRIVRASDATN